MRHLRLLLLILITIAVPFQGALAVTASQCMALQHHQDSDGHAGHPDDGHSHSDTHHDKQKQSHCSPCAGCCASAAIAGAIRIVPYSPAHGLLAATPDLPPLVPPLSGIDRPPRSF